MGFSDHLEQPADPNLEQERLERLTAREPIDVPTGDEEFDDDEPAHTEYSGPSPYDIPEATVVKLTAKVDGQVVFPDIPNRAEVEAGIKQLTPADIRGEMLLNQEEAALLVGVTPPTLRVWRDQRINLPFYISPAIGKFNNRRIFYRVADLIRYREFVLSRITPIGGTHMPPPGMMGTPLT